MARACGSGTPLATNSSNACKLLYAIAAAVSALFTMIDRETDKQIDQDAAGMAARSVASV